MTYSISLKAFGVVSASLRKVVVKWLWLANPTRSAISAMGRSVSDYSFLDRSIRCSIVYTLGLTPIDCLKAREK